MCPKCKSDRWYFDSEARCRICSDCGEYILPSWFTNREKDEEESKKEQERLDYNTHKE